MKQKQFCMYNYSIWCIYALAPCFGGFVRWFSSTCPKHLASLSKKTKSWRSGVDLLDVQSHDTEASFFAVATINTMREMNFCEWTERFCIKKSKAFPAKSSHLNFFKPLLLCLPFPQNPKEISFWKNLGFSFRHFLRLAPSQALQQRCAELEALVTELKRTKRRSVCRVGRGRTYIIMRF